MINMKKVIKKKEEIKLSKQLKDKGKIIILAGGCFDILHPGHLQLLEHAKEKGDILFVFLESDKKITELKDPERPLHTQSEPAAMLIALRFVDSVLLLPYFSKYKHYV